MLLFVTVCLDRNVFFFFQLFPDIFNEIPSPPLTKREKLILHSSARLNVDTRIDLKRHPFI